MNLSEMMLDDHAVHRATLAKTPAHERERGSQPFLPAIPTSDDEGEDCPGSADLVSGADPAAGAAALNSPNDPSTLAVELFDVLMGRGDNTTESEMKTPVNPGEWAAGSAGCRDRGTSAGPLKGVRLRQRGHSGLRLKGSF
jgi:hypothetical protein